MAIRILLTDHFLDDLLEPSAHQQRELFVKYVSRLRHGNTIGARDKKLEGYYEIGYGDWRFMYDKIGTDRLFWCLHPKADGDTPRARSVDEGRIELPDWVAQSDHLKLLRTDFAPPSLSKEQERAKATRAYVSGTAGSGKTLVVLEKMADRLAQGDVSLYLTRSPTLAKNSLARFERLFLCRYPRIRPKAKLPFWSFRDLCVSLHIDASSSGPNEFRKWFRSQHSNLSQEAVWWEIQAILKGSELALQGDRQGLLPFAKYVELGERKGVMAAKDRSEVHKLAVLWQHHADRRQVRDQADLDAVVASRLAQIIDQWHESGVQQVEFDECQDAPRLFIDALSEKLKGRGIGFCAAGDEAQTIYPTQFDFSALHPTRPERLNVNFRNPRAVVDLLVRLRETVNKSAREVQERWTKPEAEAGNEEAGLVIVVHEARRDELVSALHELGTQSPILLVPTEEDKERIDETLRHKAYSAEQFKGQEAETVLLWGCSMPVCRSKDEYWAYTLGVNRLYVLLTRTTKKLVLFGSSLEELVGGDVLRPSSREELLEALRREDEADTVLWRALLAEENGEFDLAADGYDELGSVAKAIWCRAKAREGREDWDGSAKLFLSLPIPDCAEARRVLKPSSSEWASEVRLALDYRDAKCAEKEADVWERLGEIRLAIGSYLCARRWTKVRELLRNQQEEEGHCGDLAVQVIEYLFGLARSEFGGPTSEGV